MMPGTYGNLPNIDTDTDGDDVFAPANYRRYLDEQQQQQQQHKHVGQHQHRPSSTSMHQVPSYHEQADSDYAYGAYPAPDREALSYQVASTTAFMTAEDEKEALYRGQHQHQQQGIVTRYATPELEMQAGPDERSFDGATVYASTEGGDQHNAENRHHDFYRPPLTAIRPTPRFGRRKTKKAAGSEATDDKKDEELLDEKHYGPAPSVQLRRNRTRKRIALTSGNLVIDPPIPSRLASFLPRKGNDEFDRMRYTAVTCDPDDFGKNDYTLRPVMYNRETELLIGVTMYNEDEVLLTRTLHGVLKNISHLCSRQKSKVWGKDGWKKIVICIIADGRKNVHPRVFDCLAALGVYQKDVGKNKVDGKTVHAHVYEYTTQLSISPDMKFKGLEKGIVPAQIVFCCKEKNAKKINSHRWLFNAFCPLLKPNVVVLLDVGTKPGPKSLYNLWKTFDLNSNVAGACGEICTMKGKFWTGLLNPMVAAQNFEYKMSNILDKPTESLFGYISVLPGAFSAYRYIALKNDDMGRGPLASYFKGETLAGNDADIFTSNMYLAEDRILCWELVAKRGDSWVLKFVKSAVGETDVPDNITEFISQRRRWLNGSFFAATYAIAHVLQIRRTEHSAGRKAALYFETLYNAFNLLFAWFGVANYYIFFTILTSSLEDPQYKIPKIDALNTVMNYVYAATLAATFLLSMGNRPVGAKWKYMGVMVIFSLLTVYMMVATVFCLISSFTTLQSNSVYAQLIISLAATYGVYLLSSLLALDPWHMFTCILQYMLCSPIWINVLNIYAFSNLHDFSWGTKEDRVEEDLGSAAANKDGTVEVELPTDQADIDVGYDDALHSLRTRPKLLPRNKTQAEKDKMKYDYYASMRTSVVLVWALSNGVLAAAILQGKQSTSFTSGSSKQSIYMLIILVLVAALSAFRLAASTAYLLVRLFAG